MLVALDLDGCIDSYPRELQSIMSALRAVGHTVQVVTGVNHDPVTEDDLTEKANYLASLGCGDAYDRLVVISRTEGEDHSAKKAEYLMSVGAHVLIDNNKDNIKAAAKAGIALCLLTWQSREG